MIRLPFADNMKQQHSLKDIPILGSLAALEHSPKIKQLFDGIYDKILPMKEVDRNSFKNLGPPDSKTLYNSENLFNSEKSKEPDKYHRKMLAQIDYAFVMQCFIGSDFSKKNQKYLFFRNLKKQLLQLNVQKFIYHYNFEAMKTFPNNPVDHLDNICRCISKKIEGPTQIIKESPLIHFEIKSESRQNFDIMILKSEYRCQNENEYKILAPFENSYIDICISEGEKSLKYTVDPYQLIPKSYIEKLSSETSPNENEFIQFMCSEHCFNIRIILGSEEKLIEMAKLKNAFQKKKRIAESTSPYYLIKELQNNKQSLDEISDLYDYLFRCLGLDLEFHELNEAIQTFLASQNLEDIIRAYDFNFEEKFRMIKNTVPQLFQKIVNNVLFLF